LALPLRRFSLGIDFLCESGQYILRLKALLWKKSIGLGIPKNRSQSGQM
jgi:hypothetical protein